MTHLLKANHRSSGFTLIELMIAVFVLAVGLLGVASMQAVGVQEAQNTYFRTQADMLAKDIADKIRVNRSGIYDTDGSPVTPGTPCLGAGSACTEDEMAIYDIGEWQTTITNSRLPSAVGTVTSVVPSGLTANFTIYLIQVFWDEERDGSAGQGCDPTNPADMACVQMYVYI